MLQDKVRRLLSEHSGLRGSRSINDDAASANSTSNDAQNDDRPTPNKTEFQEQGESQALRDNHRLTPRPSRSSIIPGVRKCNWENFVNRFGDNEPIHAVEALIVGDQLGRDMLHEASKRKQSGFFQAADYAEQSRVNKIHTKSSWIQRIRVQSEDLLEIFSRVTGFAWGAQSYTFMRPFQYLIHFHEALKQELLRLEGEAAGRSTSEEETAGVLHLRSYIKFAEEEILPDSRRFKHQATTTPTASLPIRIRFTDLWYLLRPGDLLYLPDRTLKRFLAKDVSNKIFWSAGASHESSMRQKIWRLYHVIAPYTDPEAPVDIDASGDRFVAYLYHLDYDGSSYSPVCNYFTIPYFEGEKDIRDLELYPLRFAAEASELLEEQKRVGSLFTKCVTEWHMSYNGWTLITDPIGWPVTEESDLGERQVRPKHVQGEVIVDFNEAFNSNPVYKNSFEEQDMLAEWLGQQTLSETIQGPDLLVVWSDNTRSKLVSACHEVIVRDDDTQRLELDAYYQRDSYLGSRKSLKQVPEGDDLALLSRRVFVYSLKDGEFFPVDVRYMKTLDHRDDGFSRLQLPEGHKRMIQSAVRSHLRRKAIERVIEGGDRKESLFTQDFIRGKGRGLILMLHGEPGIGKTATAEAVAQTYRRPLFPITCGNITKLWDAESKLEEVFRLADLWDCILLLDEADVFLSARTPTDSLERNSMVSIALRMLEYYNGILFLTTNRIGKIDQAISSRIHIMLHYSRLGRREIENVFRINIDRLKQAEQQQSETSGEQPLVIVESDILQFVADHCNAHPKDKGAWNGRQIRNAFIVAAALARAEAEHQSPDFQPQLRYWHFKQVENLTGEYAMFRQNVLGKNDAQLALLNEERDDDYEGMGTRVAEADEVSPRPHVVVREGPPPASEPWARMAFIPQHGHYTSRAGRQMDANPGGPPMTPESSISSYSHHNQPHVPPNPHQLHPRGGTWMSGSHGSGNC